MLWMRQRKDEKGISENTRDNRNRFIEFLKMHDLRAMNTWFQKPPGKLVTYKEKVPQHNPDKPEYIGENKGSCDYSKYAQCDYFITGENFRHMVKDCEVRLGKEKTRITTQYTQE